MVYSAPARCTIIIIPISQKRNPRQREIIRHLPSSQTAHLSVTQNWTPGSLPLQTLYSFCPYGMLHLTSKLHGNVNFGDVM